MELDEGLAPGQSESVRSGSLGSFRNSWAWRMMTSIKPKYVGDGNNTSPLSLHQPLHARRFTSSQSIMPLETLLRQSYNDPDSHLADATESKIRCPTLIITRNGQ